jgi:nucleoid DNA-binding protein
MVKSDLVDKLTTAFPGITKRDMAMIINTFFGSLVRGLERGEAVDLRGLGRLAVKKRLPMKGRNPRTAMDVDLPVRWVVHFKPGSGLIRALNRHSEPPQSSALHD